MTYPILYEINQYIKQIYDVKTSIKKKLNYEFFYSFNFFISCIICKILFTLQQNVFIATNFSEEIFFVTENLHLATKYIIRH